MKREQSVKIFWTSYPLFQHVKIINDDSDKQVKCEEGATHDEYHKVDVGIEVGLPLGLQVNSSCVDRVGHHLHPALEGRHLEESQVGYAHVVERDLGIDPRIVAVDALPFVIHNLKGSIENDYLHITYDNSFRNMCFVLIFAW